MTIQERVARFRVGYTLIRHVFGDDPRPSTGSGPLSLYLILNVHLLTRVDIDVVAYEEVYQSNVIARIDDGTVIVLADETAQQVNKRTNTDQGVVCRQNTNQGAACRPTTNQDLQVVNPGYALVMYCPIDGFSLGIK